MTVRKHHTILKPKQGIILIGDSSGRCNSPLGQADPTGRRVPIWREAGVHGECEDAAATVPTECLDE